MDPNESKNIMQYLSTLSVRGPSTEVKILMSQDDPNTGRIKKNYNGRRSLT